MLSRTDVVLAVAIPLLLCVLALSATCFLLWLRFRRHRVHDSEERARLEKQLGAFPKASENQWAAESGFSRDQVRESFGVLSSALRSYVEKWITCRDHSSCPTIKESVTRIELLLFPEAPPEHPLTAGKDVRRFPNPHQYTPTEICTLLENKDSREGISCHILWSILLRGISIEGNPFQTLLPFDPTEVYALDKLKTLIRGVELFTTVPVHISKFAVHYVSPPRPGNPQAVLAQRAQYIELFESVLEPCIKNKSPADVAQRQLQLNVILDAAIQLGPKKELSGLMEDLEKCVRFFLSFARLVLADAGLIRPPPLQDPRSSRNQDSVMSILQFAQTQPGVEEARH